LKQNYLDVQLKNLNRALAEIFFFFMPVDCSNLLRPTTQQKPVQPSLSAHGSAASATPRRRSSLALPSLPMSHPTPAPSPYNPPTFLYTL